MLVFYKKPNLLSVQGFDFLPGMNDVPAAKWAECAKNPLVILRLEEGLLEVVKSDEGKPVEVKDVAKLPVKKAADVAAKTHEPELLEKIKTADARPEVQKAVKAQEKAFADLETKKKG